MDLKYGVGLLVILIIIIAVLTFGTGSNYDRIEIAGSTSVQPVAEKLAEKYMEEHPNVRVDVMGGGSGLGIRSVFQDIIAIGTSSKELKTSEKDGLIEYPIGREGILVAVNLNNPVNSLSKSQIKDIFSGNITNWKEVGGPDAKINLVVREDGSGTRSAFEDLVMNKTKVKSDAIVQTSTESIKVVVKQDPNAIGYISLAHMTPDVKALKIDGISPSIETIKEGTYKLQRPFLFVTNGEPEGPVKEFIDWCLGPEGQEIVKDEKIVPVT
ncbi:MAG: phosphate ABC transporter substrate-binding protein [Methanobacterium sp.]|jgi:phosphate transport system substrate-binding protein|uniref:phosphate ABC transporter substrate-binding protein n=1 Tax=Methanobacterium sp. TaxID=2164 RepID=UPI0025836EF2|nr:phosphate ABC transporter substrate-binding protein [Methanobacterium sp.]MCC7559912.1 phosphate ABC transporter substrate-binding protein [Methanobacterium sp.]